jgi:hypothetical protein
MKSISTLLRKWLARLAPDRCPGVSPGSVGLVLKNQKIEPQMNRMNADKQSEKNSLYLCSSSASIWVHLRLKILKLTGLGVSTGAVKCARRASHLPA